jgi:hypothetical protein
VGLYIEAEGTLEVNLGLLGNQRQPTEGRRRVTMFEQLMHQYGYGKHGGIEVIIIGWQSLETE